MKAFRAANVMIFEWITVSGRGVPSNFLENISSAVLGMGFPLPAAVSITLNFWYMPEMFGDLF